MPLGALPHRHVSASPPTCYAYPGAHSISIFTFEHSGTAYRTDFAFYSTALTLLFGLIVVKAPTDQYWMLAAAAVAGMAAWTLVEYVVHRFVLHGIDPFRRLHAQHHARPTAMVYAPTLLSAALIVILVFMPARMLLSAWTACAVTWGVTAGYLAYSITHHAVHHWQARSAWLIQRRRRHAMHHIRVRGNDYGVTSSIWDRLIADCASHWSTSGGWPRSSRKQRTPSPRDHTP